MDGGDDTIAAIKERDREKAVYHFNRTKAKSEEMMAILHKIQSILTGNDEMVTLEMTS